jgi:ubiquinone/menaquinone biosynthesis C-methylase UbiE
LGSLKKTKCDLVCLNCKKKYQFEDGILKTLNLKAQKDNFLQEEIEFSKKYTAYINKLEKIKDKKGKIYRFYKKNEEIFDRDAGLSIASRLVEKKALKTFINLSQLNFSALKVLNIGCGGGKEALWLFEKGVGQVVCLDVSLPFLKLAKKRLHGKKANFIQAKGEKLPFKDNSFDLVFYMGALHHLKNISLGLKEAARVSRRIAILSEPTSTSFITSVLNKLGWNTEYNKIQTKRINKKEVKKILTDLGFEVRTKTNFIWYPFPVFSLIPFLNLKNNKFFLSCYFNFLAFLDLFFPFLGHNLTVFAVKK